VQMRDYLNHLWGLFSRNFRQFLCHL